MTNKLSQFLLTAFLLLGTSSWAQYSITDNVRRSKVVLSPHLSTQGVGLDIKYAFQPEFAIRGGASILPFNGQTVYSVSSQPTDVDFDVDFKNAHLLFDWHPFLDEPTLSSKVVVTAGAGYFWKDKGTVVVSYRGTYKYGDILIPSDELGQLEGVVQWNKVAPYLGFGFENVFPSHRFNLGFAVGTYYMGAPDVTLVGTKYLAANTSNQKQLQENMSHYRFMPVVQVNFNFGL